MSSKNILIIYDTVDWHTKKIVEFVKKELSINWKNSISVYLGNEYPSDFTKFDKILIASSIRYGKILPSINKLVQQNYDVLNKMKTGFININLSARKEWKDTPETNIYTKKFFKKSLLKPKIIWVFAGKLDYSLYWFFDTIMIKLIMKITWWPTKTLEAIEYTNWEKLKEFTKKFNEL